jgi:hypothetical protein
VLDRLARPLVRGLGGLEQAEDVLRTGGSPQGEQLVIGVRQRSAAADGHEARILDLGQDHRRHVLLRTAARRSSIPAMPRT